MRKYLLFTTFFLSLFLTQNINSQTITAVGMTFSPDTITVSAGTTITFALGPTHNAVEVDQATWIANGTNSNGGFNIPFGGGPFTPVIAQTYYYVCQPHAGAGMKGVIIVNSLPPPVATINNVQITQPLCTDDWNGVCTTHVNQTTPLTDLDVFLYWQNNLGNWIQLGYSDGPNNQFVLNGLGAGNFYVEIIDPLFPTVSLDTAHFTVIDPPLLTVSATVLGNVINTTVSGGTPNAPPFSGTYSWSTGGGGIIPPGQQGSPNLSGLVPGNYEVLVTDANGCDAQDAVTIFPPDGSWDCIPGQGCIDPGTGNGLYSDSLVCVSACPLCGSGTVNVVNVSCFLEVDGQIQINNAWGTAPFTYSIDTVLSTSPLYPTLLSTNSRWTTNNTFHIFSDTTINSSGSYALKKDIYYYTFEDASGCDTTITVVVDRDGDPIVVIDTIITFVDTLSSLGLQSGSIELNNILGGYPNNLNPGYTFQWYDPLGNLINQPNSPLLDSLAVGSYYVTITDNGPHGCKDSLAFEMQLAPSCSAQVGNLTHNICPGTNEGAAQINYVSGYNSYFFVDSLSNPIPGGDTTFIGGLSSGTYSFIMIADGINCFDNDTLFFEILEPELNTIRILAADTLCSKDSSQIEVEFNNLDPSIAYTYQIRDMSINPPSGDPVDTTYTVGDTSSAYLSAGDYAIRLYQNNLWCVSTLYSFTIDEYELEIIDVAKIDEICGESLGKITITTGTTSSNLPISYFINGDSIVPPPPTSATDSFLVSAGIYDSIYVRDAEGCKVYWDVPIEIENIILTNVMIETVKETCREEDGIISIIPSGGFDPYTIVINGDTSNSTIAELDTLLIDTLVAGTYIILVSDDKGCDTTINVVVDKVVPLELLSLDKTKESCCGFDGSIFTNINQGDGDTVWYRISFDNIAIAIDSALGVYPFMDGLNVWPSQSYITDFNNDPSHIQDSANFVGLTRGYYKIHINDEFGCVDSVDYVSYQSNQSSVNTKLGIDTSLASQLDMQISFTNMLCYDSINGTVKVLYPNACYDYELWLYNDTLNPNLLQTDTSSSIDSLIYYNELYKGLYGVQAMSYSGYSGCVVRSDTFEILEPEVISYSSPLSSAVYCTNPNMCDGEVWLPSSPIGGIVDTSSITSDTVYKYYISRINSSVNYFEGPIFSDLIFDSLCVGEYEVQVLDGNNCIIRDTISVLDSSLYLDSFNVSTISCYDSSDAMIQVYVHGGREPIYTYVWTDSTNTVIDSSLISQIDSLTEGMYYVTVYDSVGCMVTGSAIVLPAPNELVLAAKREDFSLSESCIGESYDGSIAFEIRGGTKPYIFNWVSSSDSTINGSDVASSIYCDTCTSYQWDNQQFDSVFVLNGLTADIYTILLTDASGCSDTLWLPIDSFEVQALNQNNPLIIDNLSNTDYICFGASSGELILDINPAASWPLTYSIYTGGYSLSLGNSVFGGPIDSSTGGPQSGFSNYNGHLLLDCTTPSKLVSAVVYAEIVNTITFELRTNSGLVLDDTTITVQVGMQRLYFDFDIPAGVDLELGVSSGNTRLFRDNAGNGNSMAYPYNIGNNVTITTSGPGDQYYYFYYDLEIQELIQTNNGNSCDSLIFSQNDSLFETLYADTFCVVITDVYGCTIDTTVIINQYDSIGIIIDKITNVSCYNGSDGSIEVSAFGGVPQYSWLWSNGTTNSLIENLSIGTYTVNVSDALGCQGMALDIQITEPDPLQLLATVIKDVSCNSLNDGQAVVTVSGGTPGYTHHWSNNEQDSIAVQLGAGVNTDTVRDANGCTATIDVIIDEPSQLDLTVSEVIDNLCFGGESGEISVIATGGTPTYKYSIDTVLPVTGYDISSTFSNLGSNEYILSVIDLNGCEFQLHGEKVGEPGEIEYTDAIWTDLSCYQSADGKIELTIFGGVAPYNYELINNTLPITSGIIFQSYDILELNNLDVGNYTVNVIDHNGCVAPPFTGFNIEEPLEIIADFILSETLINKGSTVSITNLSSPGSNEWIWNFGDGTQEDYTFEPSHQYINQGTYVVSLIANNLDLSEDCSDTLVSTIEVEGYDVNNIFTPNNDGINDQFHFYDEMLSELNVNIYNRWGVKVYHWETSQGFWDGRGYNGELLPEGVYFFTMDATGENGNSYTEKGSITLIR